MTKKRTSPTTVVATLMILWGLVMATLVLNAARGADLAKPSVLAVGSQLLLLEILWVVSGMGLLFGWAWGWWVASTHLVLGLLRHGVAVALVHSRAPQLQWAAVFGGGPRPTDPTVPFLAVLGLVIFVYTQPVRSWCEATKTPAKTALAVSAVAAAALFGAGVLAAATLR